MAHTVTDLRRITSINPGNTPNTSIHFFACATADTLAVASAAGYFNNSRGALTVNSIINILTDTGGTPNYATLRVTAVPAAPGNITTILDGDNA